MPISRTADLVVQVALVAERRHRDPEDGSHRLLRRRLGDRAGHADDQRIEAHPPVRGDRLEAAERVRDDDDARVPAGQRLRFRRARCLRDENGRRAGVQGRGDEPMSVSPLARQRDEQVARRHKPRIHRRAEDRPVRAGREATARGGGEVVRREPPVRPSLAGGRR